MSAYDKLSAMWMLFAQHFATGFGLTAGMWVFCKMTRWAPVNVGTRIINVRTPEDGARAAKEIEEIK